MNIFTKKSICIHHMMRSGGHAIVYWLASQIKDFKYINNFDPNFSLAEHKTLPWKYGLPGYMKDFGSKGRQFEWVYDEFNKFNISKNNCCIYTVEDYDPSFKCDSIVADKKYQIIVLRDPYNWLASRFQAFGGLYSLRAERICPNPIELWIKQAKIASNKNELFYVISYNQWFNSLSYRQSISNYLEIDFNDIALNQVNNYGGGSSFDKTDFNGKAQEMDIYNRWKIFKEDKEYLSLFTKEICDLSDKLFPECNYIRKELNLF